MARGGYQTDFARNWMKEGQTIVDMIKESVSEGFKAADLEPQDVDVAHVGNFAAELYCKQGHLGAFMAEVDPALSGIPTSRHEAACASGSVSMLMASAEIEAGRYDLALIVGVEQMKTVDPATGGDFLAPQPGTTRRPKALSLPFPSCSVSWATCMRDATV